MPAQGRILAKSVKAGLSRGVGCRPEAEGNRGVTSPMPLRSELHSRWLASQDMAGQELSLSCGSLCHVKCQAGKLRPVEQAVGWINTAMAVDTGVIQGRMEGLYVNLGIAQGLQNPAERGIS